MSTFKIALIQMSVVDDKDKNLHKAKEMIKQGAVAGAQLVILPEMFNCPYENKYFPQYAEKEGELSWLTLSQLARRKQIFIVGGSIPEKDHDGKIYNTSYVFNPQGDQIAKYRKIHLFDIDVQGGQYFKESDTLTPGKQMTVFNTPYGVFGLMICYDLRFPELARALVHMGAQYIIVPAAFNMTTGPVHWELLFRARAVDNQVFTIGVAPARGEKASYISYGNSLAVDPWGEILGRLNGSEGVLTVELDLKKLAKIREELPLLKHLRKDIY